MVKLEIPIFNRVEEVGFLLNDFNEIPLEKDDLDNFSELRQFTVSKKGRVALSESDMELVKELVPAGRVASVEKTEKRVSIQVGENAAFACK